jgi:hypothetical protein
MTAGALALIPGVVSAHAPGGTSTFQLTSALGQPGTAIHAAGPGYWWFTLETANSHVRQVTYSIRDGCDGDTIWTTTIPNAWDDLSDYLGRATPTLSPLPASWDVDPTSPGWCIQVEADGKKKAAATVSVRHPADRVADAANVWSFVRPGGYGAFHADGSVTWTVEGFARDAEDNDTSADVSWSVDGSATGPAGTTLELRLYPGAHDVTAAFQGASDTVTLTVLDFDVTVDVDNAVAYRNRDVVPITVTVLEGGAPFGGVEVDVDVFTPKGTWLIYRATTDESGTATVEHLVRTGRDGAGTYDVRAAVIYENDPWLPTVRGYGFDDATFEVVR